jgi:hypothetical protein
VRESSGDGAGRELYQSYLDMAPDAREAYNYYRLHGAWKGKRLRKDTKAVERNQNQEIMVVDGLVFPMISAFSLFVRKKDGHWRLIKSPVFRDEMVVEAAVEQFREACNSNPVVMGRSPGAYECMFVSRMSLLVQSDS